MGQRPVIALAVAFSMLLARSARAEPPEPPPDASTPDTKAELASEPVTKPEAAPAPDQGGAWKSGEPLRLSMIAGLIVGGVGVLSFAPGGALIGYGTSVGGDADALTAALPSRSACLGDNKHADCATIQANLKTEEDLVAAGTITMAIGGLALSAGIMMFVTGLGPATHPAKDAKPATTAFLPWAGPDGAGAAWSSTF